MLDEHTAKPTDMKRMVRTLIVKRPTISVSDLCEKVRDAGHHISDRAIADIRSDCRATLRIAAELGEMRDRDKYL